MKTRFAPSPTGYIHIGNVRSAIYPYLLAHQQQGTFILRIEDTDQARFVEGATELIEDTLKWLSLDWDEGLGVGGPNGPYIQTERREIYQAWAEKLIAKGRAYYDPTPPEKVQEYRDQCAANKVPFLYRNFRPENAGCSGEDGSLRDHPEATAEDERRSPVTTGATDAGREKSPSRPAAIRFLSDPKPRQWHDEVMGDMKAGPEVQDDIILIKADGLPTYNFAHIVDDALMEIDYVIRGVEYLSSTPNYLALYEALDLKVPKLVSLPHILAPTGNKKLGKRDGAKSVTEYRADGVLPEAMLNYLANLGWNDGTEQEIYTKDELISRFSLDRVQTSGARYDEVKLLWLNGQWIRKIATGQAARVGAETDVNAVATPEGIAELYSRTAGFWPETAEDSAANAQAPEDQNPATDDYKKQVLSIIYDRLKTLSDLQTMTGYFFTDPEIDLEMLTDNKFLKKLTPAEIAALLRTSVEKLSNIDWTADTLKTALNDLLVETEKKPAELFSAIRLALSFAPFSPALDLTMSVLGRTVSLSRLNNAIKALETADKPIKALEAADEPVKAETA